MLYEAQRAKRYWAKSVFCIILFYLFVYLAFFHHFSKILKIPEKSCNFLNSWKNSWNLLISEIILKDLKLSWKFWKIPENSLISGEVETLTTANDVEVRSRYDYDPYDWFVNCSLRTFPAILVEFWLAEHTLFLMRLWFWEWKNPKMLQSQAKCVGLGILNPSNTKSR